jgi:DNA repair photolyase
VALISRFDPWRSSMCTCPAKLTFNPYTGCDHSCVYCYASSYIPQFTSCRPKKDLLKRLQREAMKLKGEIISIANSSDPYPRMEAATKLTRRCLEVLAEYDCQIQLVTKSDLVIRDNDLLKKRPSTVALTITTVNTEAAKLLESDAPPPYSRIRAAEYLIKKGIPVSVRIDPIIPFVNENQEKLITILASIGVKHVTSSTYKLNPENWRRFSAAMPIVAKKLKLLYFKQGEKIGGSTLLSRDLRLRIMKKLRDLTIAKGMQFGVCREGLTELNTAVCDGSWLLSAKLR